MANDRESPKPSPNPMAGATPSGIGNGSQSQSRLKPQDLLQSVASAIASQPLLHPNAKVWGVLTAICCNDLNRMRPQSIGCSRKKVHKEYNEKHLGQPEAGINVLLTSDEHVIGRSVIDASFKNSSSLVSPNQCKIYRKRVTTEDVDHQSKFNRSIFLKDTSTNGTYLNWKKLNSYNSESKLHHGDIISFAGPPQHELAYAFVFREVLKPTSGAEVLSLKRKTVECGPESKRLKGIGVGASEGPISLSDFRSPERSNTELQKQLDDQLVTTGSLDSKNMAATEHREEEKKDIEKSVSESCIDQHKDLQQLHMEMQKEAMEVNKISAYELDSQEDRVQRLADEIKNQEASVSQPKRLLDTERAKRKEENALISELEARLEEERSLRKEDKAYISELKTLLGRERTMRKWEKAYMSGLKVQLNEERAQRKGDKASITELKAQLDEERARRKEEQASISELNALLDEERAQRKEEKEKFAVNLEASMQRARAEAREELKLLSDATFGFFDLGMCMDSKLPSDEC